LLVVLVAVEELSVKPNKKNIVVIMGMLQIIVELAVEEVLICARDVRAMRVYRPIAAGVEVPAMYLYTMNEMHN
jgi:hypothetical protein